MLTHSLDAMFSARYDDYDDVTEHAASTADDAANADTEPGEGATEDPNQTAQVNQCSTNFSPTVPLSCHCKLVIR